MALRIQNPEVEALVSQVAAATGETKTEAIRKALEERRDRLGLQAPETALAAMEQSLRHFTEAATSMPFRKKKGSP